MIQGWCLSQEITMEILGYRWCPFLFRNADYCQWRMCEDWYEDFYLKLILNCGETKLKACTSPGGKIYFTVDAQADVLDDKARHLFHNTVAKLTLLDQESDTRYHEGDCGFVCTGVTKATVQYHQKLRIVLGYFKHTLDWISTCFESFCWCGFCCSFRCAIPYGSRFFWKNFIVSSGLNIYLYEWSYAKKGYNRENVLRILLCLHHQDDSWWVWQRRPLMGFSGKVLGISTEQDIRWALVSWEIWDFCLQFYYPFLEGLSLIVVYAIWADTSNQRTWYWVW